MHMYDPAGFGAGAATTAEALLRLALRAAALGSWVLDLASDRVTWSDTARTMLGLPHAGPVTAEEALAFCLPQHRPRLQEGLRQAIEFGEGFDLEVEALTTSGARKWVRLAGEAARDDSGRIFQVHGVLQDVSRARMQPRQNGSVGDTAPLALRGDTDLHAPATDHEGADARRLLDTINALTVGFATVNRHWELTYVNPAAETILNMARQQLVGTNLWTTFPELPDHPLGAAYAAAMNGSMQELEAFYEGLDLWLWVRAIPTEEGIAICFTDTTRGRKAQQEVLRLNAELEQRVQERTAELARVASESEVAHRFLDRVIENIPDALFVKDARDRRYFRVNRAMEELVGRPRSELLGRTDWDLFPSDAPAFTSKDDEILASRNSEGFVERLHTPDGVRVLLTRKLAIHDGDGQPLYLIGISKDITAEKEREQEILRLNEELQQRTTEADAANRAKSIFLATMSHEIRTPLNGMLGMLELLGLSELDQEQRATLEVVRQSSGSLLRILDDVLDFSKIEAGQLDICPEPASVAQLVHEVQQTFSAAAAKKGLRLRALTDPEISPLLHLDPLRVRQIVANFVSNAIKFTYEGKVEIVAERDGSSPQGERLRISVRDSGVGISEEAQGRLFQPFAQGERKVARRAGGTGLGLSICRRLADLMGATIEVCSALSRGTTMTLVLTAPAPLAAGADQVPGTTAAVPAAAPVAPMPRARILVVDDHPTNRMLLARQVTTLGHDVQTAQDGKEALAHWHAQPFDLVITDCEMPEMNGYELASAIRAAEEEQARARMPIVGCTAHALAGEADRCRAAGMDDYVVKPVSLQRLGTVVRRALAPSGLRR